MTDERRAQPPEPPYRTRDLTPRRHERRDGKQGECRKRERDQRSRHRAGRRRRPIEPAEEIDEPIAVSAEVPETIEATIDFSEVELADEFSEPELAVTPGGLLPMEPSPIEGRLRKASLRVPYELEECGGFTLFGRRIKSRSTPPTSRSSATRTQTPSLPSTPSPRSPPSRGAADGLRGPGLCGRGRRGTTTASAPCSSPPSPRCRAPRASW